MSRFNLFKDLPLDVLLLILEFEGFAKENQQYFIKKFKKILEIERNYKLAYLPTYYYETFMSKHLKPIDGIYFDYKFLLNYKKFSSFCVCEKPCCFSFQYYNEEKHHCGCHEKQHDNALVWKYIINTHVTREKKLLIRTQKTGFCINFW